MSFWKTLFGGGSKSQKTSAVARGGEIPKGLIRYVLLVISLPTEPNPAQTYEFLNNILPELETQLDGTAKIGTLWVTTPVDAINMTAKAVEAFGGGVTNNDRYVYRTLTMALRTGGAKCLVVYDKASSTKAAVAAQPEKLSVQCATPRKPASPELSKRSRDLKHVLSQLNNIRGPLRLPQISVSNENDEEKLVAAVLAGYNEINATPVAFTGTERLMFNTMRSDIARQIRALQIKL